MAEVFARVLRGRGETVKVFSAVRSGSGEISSYGAEQDVLVFVSALRADAVMIEAGYYLDDYLAFYSEAELCKGDKVQRCGVDYEVMSVQPFLFQDGLIGYKSVGRRKLA